MPLPPMIESAPPLATMVSFPALPKIVSAELPPTIDQPPLAAVLPEAFVAPSIHVGREKVNIEVGFDAKSVLPL